VWGGTKPKAIIDDEVYGVDDTVQGARILAIDRRGVTIDHLGMRVFYSPSSASEGGKGSVSHQGHQGR
jgi:hypothetical protein